MEPVDKSRAEGMPSGMWGLVDIVSHIEALLAQHPDASYRARLFARYQETAVRLAAELMPLYEEIGAALEGLDDDHR